MEYSYNSAEEKNTLFRLSIYENFNMERVYYAYVLMKRIFGITIDCLEIDDENVTEIEEGYLEKMNIKKILFPDNLLRLPMLPRSIECFNYERINATTIDIFEKYDEPSLENQGNIDEMRKLCMTIWNDHQRINFFPGDNFKFKTFCYYWNAYPDCFDQIMKDLQNEEFIENIWKKK